MNVQIVLLVAYGVPLSTNVSLKSSIHSPIFMVNVLVGFPIVPIALATAVITKHATPVRMILIVVGVMIHQTLALESVLKVALQSLEIATSVLTTVRRKYMEDGFLKSVQVC